MTLDDIEDRVNAAREIAAAAQQLDRMMDDVFRGLSEKTVRHISSAIGEVDTFSLYRSCVGLEAFFEGLHAAVEGKANPYRPHQSRYAAWNAGNAPYRLLALGETGSDVEINPVEERATP